MPALSRQEIVKINAKKDEIINLWNACKLSEFNRVRPIKPDKSRVNIIDWVKSFEADTRDNLVRLKLIFDEFIFNIYSSNLADSTKAKKITQYRKLIADFIGEKYFGEMYHYLPYCLFIIPEKEISEINKNYRDKIIDRNQSENRVKINMEIIDNMIEYAVNSLRKISENKRDLASKSIAIEILTGRRQFEEILNPDCELIFSSEKFKAKGLAKSNQKDIWLENLPFLGRDFEQYDGEIRDLILSARKEILEEIKRENEKDLKSKKGNLWNTPITQALTPYERFLLTVKRENPQMESIGSKTHIMRKIYAFACFQKFHKYGNESLYFSKILGHGKFNKNGEFVIDENTSKSYTIFTLKN